MTNAKKVVEHFNRKARQYEHERKKGVLGRMVSREMQEAMKVLDVKKGERVLDCGCGTGAYGKAIMKKGGKYFGIDISQRMVSEARRNRLDVKCCAIEEFIAKEKFDKILISGSLEFCDNPAAALRSCVRNLKKEGVLVMIVPRKNTAGTIYLAYHLIHGIRIKLFSLKMIKKLATQAGLSRRKSEWATSYPNSLVLVLSGRK